MRVLKFVIPVVVFFAAYALLASSGPAKASVGAVFAGAVTMWVVDTLPLAITGLLSTGALVLIGGIKEKDAFAAYGDPIVPLFIGSFILAKGMEMSGLSERFAHGILSRGWASRSPMRLLFALNFIGCFLSLIISNTAVTAMLLPVGLSVLSAVSRRTLTPYATATLLTLTWGSSIAVGMPVGTPPNLIGIAQIANATGTRISFGQWMAFAMPITIIVLFVSWGLLVFLYGRKEAPDTSHAAEVSRERLRELGKMNSSEKIVLLGFVIAMGLWILPDTCELILGKKDGLTTWLQGHATAAIAALAGAAVLFIIPSKEREGGPVLTWKEAQNIDWGTILLFGAGIAMGQALFATGLAKELGILTAKATGAHGLWEITALCTFVSIVLSELASNTAAATTLVPVAIAIANGAHVNPIPPALGVAIGASFGFMLPVSTAPNAIVYSSGLVPSKEMIKSGILLDIVGFFAVMICLMLILPRMGLA